ncbi:MAG: 4a-hydroxytetrahydrobiopterin dehydratase [Ilumatobacteraceae bacterium]|nr:4a-hydroxytetrahydrobiopterin dehydratase [Ilumatobacteraceae bacterium]
MVDKISASEFHGRTDLPDWRVVLRRIEAGFRAPSFYDAATFVGQVASAAERAGHHPDVDVRYPGVVYVSLTTHATNSLTAADVELATTISAIAADAGLITEPRSALGVEVAIDALDIDAVRPFWKAILDYVDERPAESDGQIVALVDPRRIGPAFWFQQMDAPRPQRNRIHLDVSVPHDVAEQRVTDAIAAGGQLISDDRAKAFWVLADPEGNEACVCTWQDRD